MFQPIFYTIFSLKLHFSSVFPWFAIAISCFCSLQCYLLWQWQERKRQSERWKSWRKSVLEEKTTLPNEEEIETRKHSLTHNNDIYMRYPNCLPTYELICSCESLRLFFYTWVWVSIYFLFVYDNHSCIKRKRENTKKRESKTNGKGFIRNE